MSRHFRLCWLSWILRLSALFTLIVFPLAWLIVWREGGDGFWAAGWILLKDVFKTLVDGDWES